MPKGPEQPVSRFCEASTPTCRQLPLQPSRLGSGAGGQFEKRIDPRRRQPAKRPALLLAHARSIRNRASANHLSDFSSSIDHFALECGWRSQQERPGRLSQAKPEVDNQQQLPPRSGRPSRWPRRHQKHLPPLALPPTQQHPLSPETHPPLSADGLSLTLSSMPQRARNVLPIGTSRCPGALMKSCCRPTETSLRSRALLSAASASASSPR